jgi:four helix bundle protein
MACFEPERIAAYAVAREHTRAVRALIDAAGPRGHADLLAQLRGSAASIPANILEATGEWRTGKRLNYLMIAKGSTLESWAHVDTMVDFRIVPQDQTAEVRQLQTRITAILIRTIRNLEAEAQAVRSGPRTKQ